MNDKTEFAKIVPEAIQKKAADWVIKGVDDAMDYLLTTGTKDAAKQVLSIARFRGQVMNQAFIAQYSDANYDLSIPEKEKPEE
ncbi:hypothetical protein ACIH2S_07370 [Providencia sp. PAZ2]|uniref:hypothetical protein n=1 Tax=Providencia lanzhouensis TaxID=3378099 RepID=UPI003D2A4AE3